MTASDSMRLARRKYVKTKTMPQKEKVLLIGIMGLVAVALFAFFIMRKESADQAQAPVMQAEQAQPAPETPSAEQKVLEVNGTVTSVGEGFIEVQEGDTKRTIPLIFNENEIIEIRSGSGGE